MSNSGCVWSYSAAVIFSNAKNAGSGAASIRIKSFPANRCCHSKGVNVKYPGFCLSFSWFMSSMMIQFFVTWPEIYFMRISLWGFSYFMRHVSIWGWVSTDFWVRIINVNHEYESQWLFWHMVTSKYFKNKVIAELSN